MTRLSDLQTLVTEFFASTSNASPYLTSASAHVILTRLLAALLSGDAANEAGTLAGLVASATAKDLGGGAVTNVGLVDGVDVSAHAARHNTGGADALAADAAAGTASLRSLGSTGTTACAGNDARLADTRVPSGSAGGDLSGTYPNPAVDAARGLVTTTGPTELTMGAVADGQFLKRDGSNVIGAAASGGVGAFTTVRQSGGSPTAVKNTLYLTFAPVTPPIITLPAISGLVTGDWVAVKDGEGSAFNSNVVILADGSDTIEGAGSLTFTANWQKAWLVADVTASRWVILVAS